MRVIITVISILVLSSMAAAVCLKGHPSVEEEYYESQSVFIGKVMAEKAVAESRDYYEGKNYTVQIQEILRGNPTNPIVIFSENSTGRFPMAVGNSYIIFLHYELGRYQIDNCGNSGLVLEKQDTIQTLRQIKEFKIKK